MPYFAAFLDLVRKKVVVVGGGNVATTKVRALLPCRPAPLLVVAPEASAFTAAIEDYPRPPQDPQIALWSTVVTPEHLETLGIRLLQGRSVLR